MTTTNAYTIFKPPGVHIIHSRAEIHGQGSLVAGAAVQDYVPPHTDTLSIWTDFGDKVTSNTRSGTLQFFPVRMFLIRRVV
jgi:hypothetical protein